jgi:hypothetical protein
MILLLSIDWISTDWALCPPSAYGLLYPAFRMLKCFSDTGSTENMAWT